MGNRPYNRAQAGPNFKNNHGPRHHPRPPPMPAHGGSFFPSPHFPPDHFFQGTNSIFGERARLLSSLQREDLRATDILMAISDINARLSSGIPTRSREAKWLRKDLAARREDADMSTRRERLILQRLGEVTLVIQQRERWWKVETERGLRALIGARARMGVETGGNGWGGSNGMWVADEGAWGGRQVIYEGQPQGYYGSEGWGQQLPAPGYAMVTPPSSTEGGGIAGCNDWQHPNPVESSSDWDMSRSSGVDSIEQKSAGVARSDSMVAVAAGSRRSQSRMSVPDLSSRSWGSDYVGYQYPGCSPEMAYGSYN